ncbi:MAG: hypothetical protein GF401_10935 [Chitinivibrionales bacterium]|nr:hypothetical protein [Chitinivibrionales bacterium]
MKIPKIPFSILSAAVFVITTGVWIFRVDGIHLDSVLARGDSCLNIVWTPSAANTGSDWWNSCGSGCSDDLKKCDFIAGESYRGVAYSYGGEDPYFLFRQRLLDQWPVGSHLCHYSQCGNPSNDVTGTDCSGYVCWIWDEPRVSTRELATFDRYDHIDKTELTAGDILVKHGSHTVLVVEAVDYPQILIWEATGTPINGVRERVIDLTATYWDAYSAVRNPRITTGDVSSRSNRRTMHFQELVTGVKRGEIDGFSLYNALGKRISLYKGLSPYAPLKKALTMAGNDGVVFVRYTDERGNVGIVRIWGGGLRR